MIEKCPECGIPMMGRLNAGNETVFACGSHARGDRLYTQSADCLVRVRGKRIDDLERQLALYRADVERLEAELELSKWEVVSALEDALCRAGYRIHSGEFTGWYDSCAVSSAVAAGDRLVDLGVWEKLSDGHGRRQFYRPISGKAGEPTQEKTR